MKVLAVLLLLVTLSIATSIQVSAFNVESTEKRFERFGPRVDNLLIKIYDQNESRLQQDLETGEVDIMDRDIPEQIVDKWSQAPYNESIALEKYLQPYMYILDINNNETIPKYPYWRSPTSYSEFRHAIAHVVNKTKILIEILEGLGSEMSTPVFPWVSEWLNPTADLHPYDPEEAVTILDDAGFVQGSTPNPYYNASKPGSSASIRVYPSGHEKAGQDLDQLIFYVRWDDVRRNATGYLICEELLSLGIPVFIPGPIKILDMIMKAEYYHDYHLYTGGWKLSAIPDYLYDLYHSSSYWTNGRCYNYNNVNDSELDFWLETLTYAQNLETAKTACFEAQRRLAEIVGIVPLWCSSGFKAYRRVSSRAPEGWTGIINQEGFGVNCDWTFLNMHQNTSEQGGTVNYGLYSPLRQLNPIDPIWLGDNIALSKVYDCLINCDPYAQNIIPWLAESFELGTWFNWEYRTNYTKLTFNLHENIFWQDGVPFTSDDVKFTIDYLLQYESWWMPVPYKPWAYYLVSEVEFVEAPSPYTVVVYMNVQSHWTIYNFASLFIIPKHIWQNISLEDALGIMPEPSLVGTGPFKLVEYVEGDHLLLEANHNYFKYCPIQASISLGSYRIEPYTDLYFNVTVENCFSDKNVNTGVSVYFDSMLLENATISLDGQAKVELGPFNVNRVEVGLHEIKVEHVPDTYLNRTCITTQHVWSTIIVDINLDFKVDGKDLAMAARAFASYPGNERWNSMVDINHDYKVDGKDIAGIARRFGWRG